LFVLSSPAQFSKVVGRSHDSEFSLYRIGSVASAGFKKFVETGNSDIIDTFSQGTTGAYGTPLILDAFTAPPILEGVGQTEAQFFADGNHSKVMSHNLGEWEWGERVGWVLGLVRRRVWFGVGFK
jgi:hypothetical protein